MDGKSLKSWLLRIILLLWGVQLFWLAWHFGEEAQDLTRRVSQGEVGAAIRQEDPLFRWLTDLSAAVPPDAAYVFLDAYEAGKEIEARYHLTPRRHVLLSPRAPAAFLFYALHQEGASFLIIRDREQPPGPGFRGVCRAPAFQPVGPPGPGFAFRVDYPRLRWGFYD